MAEFGNFKKNNVSFNRPLTAGTAEKSTLDNDDNTDENCNYETEFAILTGQKKKLLDFLIKRKSLFNPDITGPIMYPDIVKSLKITREAVSVLISRLVQTKLIERHETVQGRTGYVIFKYSPFIRKKW